MCPAWGSCHLITHSIREEDWWKMGIQLQITALGGPFCAHTSGSFPQAFFHSWNGVCSRCRTGEDFDSQIEHIICKRLSSQVIFLSFLQAICTFTELGPLTCRQLFRPGISLVSIPVSFPATTWGPPWLWRGEGHHGRLCKPQSSARGVAPHRSAWSYHFQVESAVVWSPVLIDGDGH